MRATGKPFNIDKKQVYEAYKAVKSKGGAAGEDGQTIEQFEADLKNNLYKIWNRMSSGTYFPPPVRAVSIPKKSVAWNCIRRKPRSFTARTGVAKKSIRTSNLTSSDTAFGPWVKNSRINEL